MLTRHQIADLAGLLSQRDTVLRAQVRATLQERCGRDIPELGAAGEDRPVPALAELFDGIDTSMVARDVAELLAIEAANAALADRTYGVCSECAEPIDLTRLIALPTALCCLACQDRIERRQRARVPPGR